MSKIQVTCHTIKPEATIVAGPAGSGKTSALVQATIDFTNGPSQRNVLFFSGELGAGKLRERFQTLAPNPDRTLPRIIVREFVDQDKIAPPLILDTLKELTTPIGLIVIDPLRIAPYNTPEVRWRLFELSVKANAEVLVSVQTQRGTL